MSFIGSTTAYPTVVIAPGDLVPIARGGELKTADIGAAFELTNGTVTSVSVATANGFAGSVANPTTTPAITLSIDTPATVRTALELGDAALLDVDTDVTLAANSDLLLATQKAVKAYVDANIGGVTDAMAFKGVIDASTNPNYPAADAGHVYKVSVAGKVGGAAGPNVEAGDTIYCITDGSAAGDHATVGANWVITQVNVDGALYATTPTNHGVLLGKGTQQAGVTAAMSNGQLLVGATGADPAPQTMSGDATLDAAGVLTLSVKPFDVYAFYPGVPAANALVLKMIAGRAASIPDDFAGSYADAEVAATASTVFTVKKNGASVGTITFAIGATTGAFVTTGGTVALAAGDKLTIHAPATPDATLADISVTLVANRT